ncbi:MAG: radical SAM protein [Candidatus Omnitrophica bacterium]|nr:radical SAM protein [Candidatus Omnitrophota bacterium]
MIRMPWTNLTAPNVMIEVVGFCNLDCRACYKKFSSHIKSMNEIKDDLESAMKIRKLHTVSLSGGEPTLHPDLCAVVEMIKREGLHVFLLTNGVLIDEDYLRRLKAAGLDFILFHVDLGQKRPDFPEEPTFADVQDRLDELVGLADSFGLDVSISFTLYDEGDERKICPYFLKQPETSFLFLSSATDLKAFYGGLTSENKYDGHTRGDRVKKMERYFQERYHFEPFAYIPTKSGNSTVWISYFIPIIYRKNKTRFYHYRSTWMDVFLMKMVQFFTGRHIHKTTHNFFVTFLRVALNGISCLRIFPAAKFLILALLPGSQLRHKMIVYDGGPFIIEGNKIEYCEYCPTAIVRNGELLSCCTADYQLEASLK